MSDKKSTELIEALWEATWLIQSDPIALRDLAFKAADRIEYLEREMDF